VKHIVLSTARFAAAFPALVEIWPTQEGRWTRSAVSQLRRIMRTHVAAGGPSLRLSLGLSKERLLQAGLAVLGSRRSGAVTSTPYRFTDYYTGLPSTPMNPGQKGKSKSKGLNASALKLRPGMDLDISLEGHPTRAVMNSVRRIELRGSKNWIKADLSIEVSKLPLLLERETKCDCRYCGSKPKGAETECSKCGAPLPDC
jgi:hypothetical protein